MGVGMFWANTRQMHGHAPSINVFKGRLDKQGFALLSTGSPVRPQNVRHKVRVCILNDDKDIDQYTRLQLTIISTEY